MSSDFERFLASIEPADKTESPQIRAERVRKALEPLLRELEEAGFQVVSLSQLRHSGRSWQGALPILLAWLPKVTEPGAKEEIVRTLSVPWIGRAATAQLIDEFKSANSDSSLAWAIGNALSIVDTSGFEQEIIGLVRNKQFGSARQMLVTALAKMKRKDAEDAVISALKDEALTLHAIDAVSRMQLVGSFAALKDLLHDRNGAVRKAAQKAIRRLEKQRVDHP